DGGPRGRVGAAAKVPDRGAAALFRRSLVRADGRGARLLDGHGGVQIEPGTQDAGRATEEGGRTGMTVWTRHVSEQLAAFADGELPPDAARKVVVHLARCATCSREWEMVKAGMASLDALTVAAAPDRIWA